MKKLLILAVFLPLLAGCKPSEEKAIELAKKEIALNLKDPDSAKFRFLRVAKKAERNDGAVLVMVCGQVNAKNTFGAYAGNQRFLIMLGMKSKSMFNNGVSYTVEKKLIATPDDNEDLIEYLDACGKEG